MTFEDAQQKRPIRSYVRREGRITNRQQHALKAFWDEFGLDPTTAMDFSQVFTQVQPVVLEIGFGMGDSLLQMAIEQPHLNFVGVEVHRPGVGSLLANAHEHGLKNLKVSTVDATQLLAHHIKPQSLQKVLILFPDPWPKKRHHKRRIINSHVINLISRSLQPGGCLHVATDWHPYAVSIEEQLQSQLDFNLEQKITSSGKANRLRPMTKFEQRGCNLGHNIVDLIYIKEQDTP